MRRISKAHARFLQDQNFGWLAADFTISSEEIVEALVSCEKLI